MRLRPFIRICAASAALSLALAAAAPVVAQEGHDPGAAPAASAGPDTRPLWQPAERQPPQAMDPGARAAWLGECRRRIAVRDDGLGGAVIGGVIGGVAGNRIAGRGHRTVGTIAGAAVGAAAGAAIDQAEDNGRTRDECEAYLDSYYDYYAHAAPGYGYPGYGYTAGGYGCCGQMAPRREPECTETVEYVDEYVPARPARRSIPRRHVPDKRIRTN
jgi:hypothetical protein